MPPKRRLPMGRLLWLLGLALGIAAGGAVAFGLVAVAPAAISAQS